MPTEIMLRERMNQHRGLMLAVASAVIVVSAVVVAYQLKAGSTNATGFPPRAFFTTDDGRTLFKDDYQKIPPFTHDGKEAVRAVVYTCDGGGHQFVLYLQKFDEPTKRQLESKAAASGGAWTGTGLVKKPGQEEWESETSPKGMDITMPRCPDGASGSPQQVFP